MGMIENVRAGRSHDPSFGLDLGSPEEDAKTPRQHELDSESKKRLHARLYSWYEQEREKQAANRIEMAMDEDYYDNLQWREDDAEVVEDRGQAPLVYNFSAQKIDWLIGTERRTRVDHKILPRKGGQEAIDDADRKTKLMKYVSDVNDSAFVRSLAFADSVKVGVGWMEEGARSDITDEPLYSGWESWRNMLWDSCGRSLDGSDWRYQIRLKSLDLDMALAIFPERAELIKSAAIGYDAVVNGDDDEFYYLGQRVGMRESALRTAGASVATTDTFSAHNRRERVRMIEIWYRQPAKRQVIRGEMFNGRIYNAKDPMQAKAVARGAVSLYDAVVMEMRVAIMVKGGLIQEQASPYRHNRFPFIPIWCYRRGRDGMPYGVMRRLRDAQDDFNKRMSKAQFLLSTRRVEMEEGAVEDIDELREEAARPDGIIVRKKGRALEIKDAPELAEQQVKLAELDVQFMESGSGVTDENLGQRTNATSGIAIQRRQDQGSTVTAAPFDNLRYAFKWAGQIRLSLIEQYFSEPKAFRIDGPRGTRGRPNFLEINQVARDPATGEPILDQDGEVQFLNDITKFEADFIVSEQDFRESMRMAMFETMMDMLAKMPPEVGIQLLDLVMEYFDVPGKDELVARIRKINGHRDPDKPMSPEEKAELEASKQAQAEQQAFARAQMIAAVQEAQGKARAAMATGEKLEVDAMAKAIDAIVKAMEGAGMVLASPGVAPAADEILKGAGFHPVPGQAAATPTPPGMPAPPPPGALPQEQGADSTDQPAMMGG